MKKLGASLLLAAAITAVGVAAPANAAPSFGNNNGGTVSPLVNWWPH
ncbi:hypothetical protein ITX31_02470 [Arthrobacter gandavensis]|nr:hypothetical protein [Arthrobacter gandavensis]MBF4992975.1 hypothetical protein [Arthrobacter gandavensis]